MRVIVERVTTADRIAPHLIRGILLEVVEKYKDRDILEVLVNPAYTYLESRNDINFLNFSYNGDISPSEVWLRFQPEGYQVYKFTRLFEKGVTLETMIELWESVGCPDKVLASNRFRGIEADWLDFSMDVAVNELWVNFN